MQGKRFMAVLLLICTIITAIPLTSLTAFADSVSPKAATNAMTSINSAFGSQRIGTTASLNDDGYIGIPVKYTIFYDRSNGPIESGYHGTPIIIYVVNANIERIGTESDVNIIRSMLDRGYVVFVLDYLNNPKASSPALEYSTQGIRANVSNKSYLTANIFPSGTYHENYVVPAGCNVSIGNVFWEADKHGTNGTLEKIVETWNNDFRGVKGNQLVKWVRADGTRKKTLPRASDGTTPVWYNVDGTENKNGNYTKVKWTTAETITDCVNPDGTPLDLNLYLHIIYPAKPKEAVPVMSIANSSGYLAECTQTADRPHFNGFLFNGYAAAMFDYLYVPMAKNESFGYYDGNKNSYSSAITGDQMTYSVHTYNDKLIDTAAMRFIRYLSLSDSEEYNFDIDSFGVFGNSKGGWMHFLGEEIVQSPTVKNTSMYSSVTALEKAISSNITAFDSKRVFEGHYGETRYEAGLVKATVEDVYRGDHQIDGGELQPWLTYDGKEIISGAQWVYASNGSNDEAITAGHAATFIVAHMADTYNAAYGSANTTVNMCRSMNIPCLFFEVPLGHTLTYGKDMNHGIDTYLAMFDFAGYYLKKDAVKVIYSSPNNNAGNVSVTGDILLKFSGPVDEEEITRISITNSRGEYVLGSWSNLFGSTEWTFTPDNLVGSETYTVTIPKGFTGDNGTATEADYSVIFHTELDSATAPSERTSGESGEYVSFTVPELPAGANKYVFRFKVSNEAANKVGIYSINTYNHSSPDDSERGNLLGSINLTGSGFYELDVTDYLTNKVGKEVTLLVTTEASPGEQSNTIDFDFGFSGFSSGKYASLSSDSAPDGEKSLKIVLEDNTGRYTNNTYYANLTTAFSYGNLIKSSPLVESDYGRRFRISVNVYDDISRVVQIKLYSCTDSAKEIIDYDFPIYNFTTQAGRWSTFTFDYVVYDMDYGEKGTSQKKGMTVQISPDGSKETPLYFNNLTVTEIITDADIDAFSLSCVSDGGIPYKKAESGKPFVLLDEGTEIGSYTSWKNALAAYKAGCVLQLRANYKLTNSDLFSNFSTISGAFDGKQNSFVIDLNGYKLKCDNTANAPIWVQFASAAKVQKTSITVKNGEILLKNTPLVSYELSSPNSQCKTYDVIFENVHIGLSDKSNLKSIISSEDAPKNLNCTANLHFKDCTINVPDNKIPYNYVTLLTDKNDSVDVSYIFEGGIIKLSSQRWISIQNSIKVSKFIKDENGEFTKLVLPDGKDPAGSAYDTENGYASFSSKEVKDGIAYYTFVKNSLSTKYGMIPEEYADVKKYPFAVFNENGEFYKAASAFYGVKTGGAMDLAKSYMTANKWDGKTYGSTPKAAYVVLRRDYIIADTEAYDNLSQIQGVLTLDLGGYTLSQTSTTRTPIFPTVMKPWSGSGDARVFPSTIVVENGTMNVYNKGVITLSSWDAAENGEIKDKNFTFEFNNVTFGFAGGASTDDLLFTYSSSQTNTGSGTATLIYNDCKFDLSHATANNVTIFDAVPPPTAFVHVDIQVNGGTILAYNVTGTHVTSSFVAEDSKLTFGKGSDGEYTTFIAPAGTATLPLITYPTSEGDKCFVYSHSSDKNTYFVLGKNPLETDYGTIKEKGPSGENYADAKTYPFALFKDGICIGVQTSWKDACTAAAAQLNSANASSSVITIYLRSDYTSAAGEVFKGIGASKGNIDVDLGKNSFTCEDGFIELFGEAMNTDATTFTVRNGSLTVLKNALITHGANVSDALVELVFENVSFRYAKGSEASALICAPNGSRTESGEVNAAFENCTFNLTLSGDSANAKIFDLSDPINVTVTVNGGRIEAESFDIDHAVKLGDGDTIVFGQYDDSFTVFAITGEAPTGSLDTSDGGKGMFVLIDGNEYTLLSCDHDGALLCMEGCEICGAEIDPDAHKFGRWLIVGGKRIQKCNCGAENEDPTYVKPSSFDPMIIVAIVAGVAVIAGIAVTIVLIKKRKNQ